MNWSNWHDFWRMGGYGLYVWGSVGAVLGALLVEWAGLGWRRRRSLAKLAFARRYSGEDGS